METFAKLVIACVFGVAAAGGRNGFGAHHALQRGGFRGGPLVAAAATPSFAAADDSGPPQPYSFSYDNTDEFGTQLFHNEQGDGSNAKSGSYGYRDANGLFRTVTYVADENGYRATVDTNEPGTAPGNSADAVFNANTVANPVAAAASAPVPASFARPGAFGGAGRFGAKGASWSG
ncbi:cuticle protein 10.9 [Rhipicephalus sanguineus]|uniref:cuticle protein 10.9 n=1 Tax=Rhipicephalus sanguineus TaxID=34632 RepID=UPI0018960121|nr:cuticle protein 10.9 [Rhipicephalus sanguineus]